MTGFPPLILHCLHVTFSLDPIVLVIVLVIAVKKVYSVSLTVPNLRYGVVFVSAAVNTSNKHISFQTLFRGVMMLPICYNRLEIQSVISL